MSSEELKESTLKQVRYICRFCDLVRDKSREISPTYPNIDQNLDIFEHLWAITSSYEGVNLANADLHDMIRFLSSKLGLSAIETYEEYQEYKREQKQQEPIHCNAASS